MGINPYLLLIAESIPAGTSLFLVGVGNGFAKNLQQPCKEHKQKYTSHNFKIVSHHLVKTDYHFRIFLGEIMLLFRILSQIVEFQRLVWLDV